MTNCTPLLGDFSVGGLVGSLPCRLCAQGDDRLFSSSFESSSLLLIIMADVNLRAFDNQIRR